jgi:SAM-dependent methyltransferase
MKSEINWHLRFKQQAQWTAPLRKHLFEKANLARANNILEIGCGTGAILMDLPGTIQPRLHALDLDFSRLQQAKNHAPSAHFASGDALALPYPTHAFDITFCHFLLLWVKNPLLALTEMRRVTRPKGAVLVMAEPDYGNRVDRPASLVDLGKLQTLALQGQGADPTIGSRLPSLFQQAGIDLVEFGSLQKQDPETFSDNDWEQEWAVLGSDLAGKLSALELARLKNIDEQARLQGTRILYVPTHFAFGLA